MSNMEEHGCVDYKDMNLDFCGDLFDHIDDLLDFPSEDIQGGGDILVGGDCVSHNTDGGFQGVWQSPSVDACSPLFSNPDTHSAFPTDLSVPDEDIAQLEWLSTFVEDSFSAATITLNEDFVRNNNNQKKPKKNNSNINDDDDNNKNSNGIQQFQTPSPVSVLESSSSFSGGRSMPISPETIVPGRARSKRPRPSTFNSRPVISLVSLNSSVTDPTPPSSSIELVSESENFAESNLSTKFTERFTTDKKKRKKKKLTPNSSSVDQSMLVQPMAVRKCLHCEITKTPQWRAGPLGPKTLCNACGVRYKSGRLFPEYRPAASPTFVPKLHSNSHKKVLEMRSKTDFEISRDEMDEPVTDFIPGCRIWNEYL